MKKFKKLLSIMLALVMVVSAVPVTAFGADGGTVSCTESGCSGTYVNGFCSVNNSHYQAATLNNNGTTATTVDDYYEIGSLGNLYWFAAKVNGGENTINAKLTADIDVSSKSDFAIGTKEYPFGGVFDGNGYTLKVNISSTAEAAAPFSYAGGASFKNLTVAGKIKTSAKFAGGFVGSTTGSLTFENCLSLVTIESTVNGDGTHGGFVGVLNPGEGVKAVMNNCGFVGAINGETTDSCGGFFGWLNATTTVTDSFVAATYTVSGTNGNAIARNDKNLTINNVYYLNLLGGAPKDAVAITADQLTSGELAYKLGSAWKQTLGTDAYPNFSGKTVYEGFDCTGKSDSYNNTGTDTVPPHSYINGICSICGGYVAPTLNADGYYEIGNAGELEWFSNYVNNGNGKTNAVLIADIDLSGVTHTPIGVNYSDFAGIFDGKGYTIRNMKFKCEQNGYNGNLTYDYQGLFGVIVGGAVVKNFTIYGEIILAASGQKYIGGAVGIAYQGSKVQNITSYVNINDAKVAYENIAQIGGVVGQLGNLRDGTTGTVENCEYYGTINVDTAASVGGIAGQGVKNSIVSGCTNYGTVGWNYIGHAGGVIGSAQSGTQVKRCANYGPVSIVHNDCVGGVVGYANEYVRIEGCANYADIKAKKSTQPNEPDVYLGGILGYVNNVNFNALTGCFNYGKVTDVDNSYTYTGAIVGYINKDTKASVIKNNAYLEGSCKNAFGLNKSSTTPEAPTSATAARFASGEIALLLNGGVTDGTQGWYQELTDNARLDKYPVLSGKTVYKYTDCKGNDNYANQALSGGDHNYNTSGTCIVCGKACTHTWENSTCTECGKVCENHSYKDGACTVCGKACENHSYKDGACTVCGKACENHSYEDGACTECGKVCSHIWKDSTCTECGLICSHEWENSTCTECGKVCEIHLYENGACTVCGKVCSHIWKDSTCTECGLVCSHKWENSICEECGKICENHSFKNGVCTICGFTEKIKYLDYNYTEKKLEEKLAEATEVTSSNTKWTNGFYVVKGNTTLKSRVKVTGNVGLILADGATLTVNGGIDVEEGNSFTVYAQSLPQYNENGEISKNSTTGKLVIQSVEEYNSGIGGGRGKTAGSIIINGGIITATAGSRYGAGIGGGRNGSGGTVTINGGTVTATGGEYGAGIGGGDGGSGGTVTINGGAVAAVGKSAFSVVPTLSGGFHMLIGESLTSLSEVPPLQITDSFYTSKKAVKLTHCTAHEDGIFYVDESTHTRCCKWCGNGATTDKHALDESGVCVCGYGTAEAFYLDYNPETKGFDRKTVVAEAFSGGNTLESGWYIVRGNVALFSRVNISGDVKLILADGATLTVNGGIEVKEGNSFTVYAQSLPQYNENGEISENSTTGKLVILNVESSNAGIGGGWDGSGGSVTINGGDVTATGGSNAAGIGGGWYGSGGTITINGGEVTAEGGSNAAGIGGGWYGSGGTITINGGEVTAEGIQGGACIGGGDRGNGGAVIINGGKISAINTDYGAGIGGGRNGSGGTVTINGGTVAARGYYSGAGIGGTVTISGGTVTATGGEYGAGIGGGDGGSGGTVTINGGAVAAVGKSAFSVVPTLDGRFRMLTGEGLTSLSEVPPLQITDSFYTSKRAVKLTLCTAHEDGIFYVDESTHTRCCKWCGYGATTERHALDESGVCVCGYGTAEAFYLDYNPETKGFDRKTVVAEAFSGGNTLESGWYIVRGNVALFSRVNISGDVKLILADGATLTVNGGIEVKEGNSFTVYAQSLPQYNENGELSENTVTGRLTVQDIQVFCGGIGSNADAGTMTFNGGVITAAAGRNAAGIGTDYGYFGNITINGGHIVTEGLGDGKNGGTLTINGGTVITTAAENETPGMGGGSNTYKSTSVTINGGTVTAKGNGSSAIGSTYGDNIVINGGTVTAIGDGASGITAESLISSSLCMYVGEAEDSLTPVLHKEKPVKFASGKVVKFEACKNHEGVLTSVDKDGHALACKWCSFIMTEKEAHSFDEATGICECGVTNASYLRFNPVTNSFENKTAVALPVTSVDYRWVSGKYIVLGSVTISSRVTVLGDVELILADGATLTVNGGIAVNPGVNSFTVYAQSPDSSQVLGKLIANGSENTAGIGGNYMRGAGKITVHGGNITALGIGGAGIGGGYNGYGIIDELTVYGGIITASSSGKAGNEVHGGAGIGGGDGGNGGKVVIMGGTVTATGAGKSAGIGNGGFVRGSDSITITGGTVTATGGTYYDGESYYSGAGIGGGNGESGGTITISGGTVTAVGGEGSNAFSDEPIIEGELRASAGSDLNSLSDFEFLKKAAACKENCAVKLVPCIQHEEGLYNKSDTTHVYNCKWCGKIFREEAHKATVGTQCICGAEKTDYIEYDAKEKKHVTKSVFAMCFTGEETVLNDGWYFAEDVIVSYSRITVLGDVKLILKEGAYVIINGGIGVGKGSSFAVYAQSVPEYDVWYDEDVDRYDYWQDDYSRTGELIVQEVENGNAGIGGEGNVTVNSGMVFSMGSGAGIGGTVVINDGVVCANGGKDSPGIGEKVTINGGEVYAAGGDNGAGIGGKEYGSCDVVINGGTVTANAKSNGAGIGSGYGGTCCVVINGGTITANVKENGTGAGIGGSWNVNGGTVTINGGEIYANGDDDGIGDGYSPDALVTVTIKGGTIVATGIKAFDPVPTLEGCFRVYVGSDLTEVLYADRTDSIYSSYDTVKLEPCTTHTGVISYVDETKHALECDICGGYEEAHKYENGVCSECDVNEPCTGTGTEADPYIIKNAGNLYWFAQKVNGGETGICARLAADITVNPGTFAEDGTYTAKDSETPVVWTPMGKEIPYVGVFDGNGKVISGLYYNGNDVYVGLFGIVGDGAIIKNVGIENTFFKSVCADDIVFVGGISGIMLGAKITGCYSNATLFTGFNDALLSAYAGGIVGYISTGASIDNAIIENCYNKGKITATTEGNDANAYVGGIAAKAYSHSASITIKNCYNVGELACAGQKGLVGCVELDNQYGVTIENCYYLDTAESDSFDGTVFKTAAQFASGEVAYLLQKGVSAVTTTDEAGNEVTTTPLAWGQTSNKEGTTPILTSNEAYRVLPVTDGEAVVNYSVLKKGETNSDGVVDIYDYQNAVNIALSDNNLKTFSDNYDLNGDGILDVLDTAIAEQSNMSEAELAAFGEVVTSTEGMCYIKTADLDGDGVVDVLDISLLEKLMAGHRVEIALD